jgi:hypothetical protein
MNRDVNANVIFKFLDAKLLVKRVKPNPAIALAHNSVLSKGELAKYNLTRVELKTFTYVSGSQSLSINNAVLGYLPKRLLFTMVKNTEFLGTIETNPYRFHHFDINNSALYVNSKQVSSESLSLGMGHEMTSVMAYRTLRAPAFTIGTRDFR